MQVKLNPQHLWHHNSEDNKKTTG